MNQKIVALNFSGTKANLVQQATNIDQALEKLSETASVWGADFDGPARKAVVTLASTDYEGLSRKFDQKFMPSIAAVAPYLSLGFLNHIDGIMQNTSLPSGKVQNIVDYLPNIPGVKRLATFLNSLFKKNTSLLSRYENILLYLISKKKNQVIEATQSIVTGTISNITTFSREMFDHIPAVNAQFDLLSELASKGTEQYLTALYTKDQKTRSGLEKLATGDLEVDQEIFAALEKSYKALENFLPVAKTMVALHDLGKWVAKQNATGSLDFGEHPWVGEAAVKGFLSNGGSIVDFAAFPDSVKEVFSEQDINLIIQGTQLGHLVMAGPGLGENSSLTMLEILGDAALQPIFADSKKSQIYFALLGLVTAADIGSVGFLSNEKIDYFQSSSRQLAILAPQIDSLVAEKTSAGKVDFSKISVKELFVAMGGEGAEEVAFWHRFTGVLSANTTPNSSQRAVSYLQGIANEQISEERLEAYQHFFTHTLKAEYFRNFFQGVMLSKSEGQLQNKDIQGFDERGVAIFDRLVADFEERRQDLVRGGKIRPDAPLIIRTGSWNSQADYSGARAFLELVSKDSKQMERFLNETVDGKLKWVEVELDKQTGTYRINYKLTDFVQSA